MVEEIIKKEKMTQTKILNICSYCNNNKLNIYFILSKIKLKKSN